MGAPQQPPDEWDFVPTESDDEDPYVDLPAEARAIHVEDDGAAAPLDPGRSDLSAEVDGEETGGPVAHFDDEEPDLPSTGRRGDEHEPDLEEILESQHYAFPPEVDVADGS